MSGVMKPKKPKIDQAAMQAAEDARRKAEEEAQALKDKEEAEKEARRRRQRGRVSLIGTEGGELGSKTLLG